MSDYVCRENEETDRDFKAHWAVNTQIELQVEVHNFLNTFFYRFDTQTPVKVSCS